MDILKIQSLLPHRYPFLLVDRVIEFVPHQRLVAIKNVTVNEPFFQGHFPGRPVFPGVLIIEALAQACGLLAFASQGAAPDGKIFYLVGVDSARFKRPVEPGDQMVLEIDFIKAMRGVWKFNTTVKVDDVVIAEAELMCAERAAKP
ncbi:MAG: 3-hydroxyacyl-ACP dehydratase FabZ [Gammaproteobacteria bacterium]|nr:3-hydroxyacyl-ACP dehydratase FabZ [Gammaproteobacteria bacterium]